MGPSVFLDPFSSYCVDVISGWPQRVREVCRNLAEKSLERAEKLLKAKSVPHHAEAAQVARRLSRILRDAGIDRTVLGCIWQDGVFEGPIV